MWIWHGTAGRTLHTRVRDQPGRATTSIDAWNRDALHVGAPWVVDRDGTIYKTFDDTAWTYHLGIKRHPRLRQNLRGHRVRCSVSLRSFRLPQKVK